VTASTAGTSDRHRGSRSKNLTETPELIDSDPYGDGWMFDAEADPGLLSQQFAMLLDADAYRSLTGAN
jgi:glycine cleavage system H protein